MVKVIRQQDASPTHMDGSMVFGRLRQCAPHPNTCFLGPIRVLDPNSISIGSAVSAQLTAESPYTLQRATLSPKIASSRRVGSGPHPIHDSLSQTELTNQTAFLSVQLFFSQVTAECPYTLQWDTTFPLKIDPSHGGSGPSSNTWFPGPTEVLNPNGISISSTILAGLTSVSDRQTDRPRYSVGNNRPHLCV